MQVLVESLHVLQALLHLKHYKLEVYRKYPSTHSQGSEC